ncbi:hypothetical protein ACFVYA_24885 [Amycolatopsis sp. NPDC058278]|uniref:hypothetical protein n=1 Tax=Amycolatopsis sp. NPDC058278 TaxID=3346417 RepID=UPI0036DA97AC
MSWQEELRRLDEELAAGQISADDYRVRRDSVLSAAVNADPQAAPAGNQAESTQIIAPVTPPPGQPQAGAGPSADQTQIVNGSFGDAERTQAVSQAGAPQGWAPAGQGDAERTQVVPGVPPQSVGGAFRPQGQGSGGFPAQQPQYHPPQGQQLPWNVPSQDTSTPWGGSEFPADTNWVGQGPEPSFETTSRKGGSKKVVAIIVAVVVLAGLGVGGYFLFSGNGSGNPTPPVASSSGPAPTQPKPKDDREIAKLPGTVQWNTDFPTFDDLKAAKVLTDEEYDALSGANPTVSRGSASTLPSGATVVVMTVKTSGSSAASDAVDKLVNLQAKYKLTKYTGTTPPGVEVMQLVREDGKALVRAHYVHKQTVVRVHVDGGDMTSVSQVFDEILAKQLVELPANG